MSDSMGEAVYKAARDGKEAELRRLIGLGGSVNWRNPEVRRRMPRVGARVVAAPGASVASPPTRRSPDTAPCPHSLLHGARRRWLCRRPAELGTRVLVAWRAPHPRVLAHAPRVMALEDSGEDSGMLVVPSTDPQL